MTGWCKTIIWQELARLLAIAAALLTLSGGGAFAEKRVALVIGNSAYKNVVRLSNPTNDATAIAALLKSSGFDVVEAENDVGNVEMRRMVRYFIEQTQDADIAVVYYAGHGIEVDGVNYLIPTDAMLEHDLDVQDEALSLDRVIAVLEPVKKLRLIILDACRDNPFSKTMKRTIASRSIARGLGKVEPGLSNTLIAFAAKAGSTASDGTGGHSPFAMALLDNLAAPGVDIRIALGRVRDEVYKQTKGSQEPFVYGSLGGGTISLVPPNSAEPKSSPIEAFIRDYQFAQNINTVEAWESFMAAYPNSGFYFNLAKAARDKLAAEAQSRKAQQVNRKAVDATSHITEEQANAHTVDTTSQAEAKAKAKAELEAKRLAGELRLKADTEEKARADADARRKSDEQAKVPQVAIALAPPNTGTESRNSISSSINSSDVVNMLQIDLKRVGCDPGPLDGLWNENASQALAQFNAHAHTNFDVKFASVDALEAVRQHKDRVCPLVCGKGYKPDGDRCEAEACRRGYFRNQAGKCELDVKAAQKRPIENRSNNTEGVVFCNSHICEVVKKGCRIVGDYNNGHVICN